MGEEKLLDKAGQVTVRQETQTQFIIVLKDALLSLKLSDVVPETLGNRRSRFSFMIY